MAVSKCFLKLYKRLKKLALFSLLEKALSGKINKDTLEEYIAFSIISCLPMGTIEQVKSNLAGKTIVRDRVAIGTIVHKNTNIPIPGLDVQLWDRDMPGNDNDYLGAGTTDDEGKFKIYYARKDSGRFDDPDLELKIFDPPQPAIIDGKETEKLTKIATIEGANNVKEALYDFGNIELEYYEYDPEYANYFPYCIPDSIKHEFVPAALAMTVEAVAKYGKTMDKIILQNQAKPGTPSYDEIQESFPKTLTLEMEEAEPGSSRTDEFFTDRMLNGFNPILFKQEASNPNIYYTAFDGSKFALRNLTEPEGTGVAIDLPNYKVSFELKDGKLHPIEIKLQFRQDGEIQTNPPMKEWETYTPADDNKWAEAKRAVRATHLGVLGEVKTHLAHCHFNMEQYCVAFFRNIRKSPLRSFLYPHLKEVVHINNFGRKILMDPKGGFFAKLEPMPILGDPQNGDMLSWVRSCIGTYQWTDWSPRKPLCENHRYAKIGNLYWDILTEYVDKFFEENEAELVKHWGEVYRFSKDLIEHSVPFQELSMEQVGDGNQYYDLNEVDTSTKPLPVVNGEKKAIRPVTESIYATPEGIANLKQLCRYMIYQLTYWHTGIHLYHNPEFGELRYGDLLRNGSMGPEDDDSIMPGQEPAAIILGASNMLTNFKYGYITKNEDGDLSPYLVELVESNRTAFKELGYDVDDLRSRLNS